MLSTLTATAYFSPASKLSGMPVLNVDLAVLLSFTRWSRLCHPSFLPEISVVFRLMRHEKFPNEPLTFEHTGRGLVLG